MKTTIAILMAIVLVGVGAYFLAPSFFAPNITPPQDTTPPVNNGGQASTTQSTEGKSVIGTSVEGREIAAYQYGDGEVDLLFVGGIHGGYEWNTVLVAYELMDYLEENPDVIPRNVQVTVIPVLNPDGLNLVVGTAGRFSGTDVPSSLAQTVPGRFNANNVDLNRNFDCDWQAGGGGQNTKGSGGRKTFFEPESQAFKTYVETHNPSAIVVWYSAAGGVFVSSCHNGVLSETSTITKKFAEASHYKAYENFDFYEITGDMVNWLAKNNIPAISVLLTNHTDVEWDKNWKGIEALLKHYAK